MDASTARASGEVAGVTSVASVAVLLCTFNGERYLEGQVDSIVRQDYPVFKVYVSDDGSTDRTPELLDRFLSLKGEERLTLRQGPRQGHVANFFSLICSAAIEANYVAYADQDDVWDTDKLSRAMAALSSLPAEQPAMYCSRTRLVDHKGVLIGLSPPVNKPPAFANALIQNIAGGNTMVLNRGARDLICAAGPVDVVSHDWWTYLLVTGSGGRVIWDPHPSVSYRQHQDNLIGSSMGWSSRLTRFSASLRGRKREWNTRNIAALQQNRAMLSAENCRLLDLFCEARNAGTLGRFLGMRRSGVYAQSGLGNAGLLAATLLNIL